MNKLDYDSKTVILDLDLLEISKYNLDDSIYAKKLLTGLTASQNLIFITDNTLNHAVEALNNLKVKSGFLIADGGASIISIANKKTILETLMCPETAIRIINQCIWHNLSFSINTIQNTRPHRVISDWLIKKYKSDLRHLYNFSNLEINSIDEIKECIRENDIKSIEVYFLENNDEIRRRQMFESIIKPIGSNKVNFIFNSSILYIVPTAFSKMTALSYLTQKMSWNIRDDGLYCGVSQFVTEISKHVYLSAITEEALAKKDHFPPVDTNQISVIPRGSTSWIKWFFNNEHLWGGDNYEKLKASLSKIKRSQLNSQNISFLKARNSKFLEINSLKKEKLKERKISKALNFLIKKFSKTIYENNNRGITRMGFWPSQIPVVVNFLENKYIQGKKTYN